MAVKRVGLAEFLTLAKTHPVLDVRSPGEYLHAHIPGAQSLPLFSDDERKVVGTAYKQESKQVAIKIGLKYFGVKMVEMVETVEKSFTSKIVLVHCWRGGMRSAGVAWLLDLYGYQVYTLQGGYKTYRGWVLEQFEKDYPIQILGGYTGSGKTEVLKALAKKSECVIDLEGLAGHKGSAFGNMGLPAQPSQEMFENKLAQALANTAPTEDIENPSPRCIWMEDESQRIGTVNIPTVLYQKMRQKKVFFLDIPFESRLDYICIHYGKFPKEQLINAIIRIKKKLGGLETKTAINSLVEDDVRASFRVLLQYYDKLYGKGLERNRENLTSIVTRVEAPVVDDQANAALLLALN
ncbi:MAG: tRNA 2-selenouridine(34) synthase MnmH [Bacteroidetes bacterium 24-39-8]|jgi:tRNA 2-selenouridine synthase|nr:MAG: tRNA 2-selenouridine(34) synthase MnmH [Sphingobacteriia bacterium 35-40-8]OYZ51312.1 MAG: tRNA 2-selenouridine(34) synthase MnmH [Bacteroidetes bacterium 24-39-8]OZA65724.1 MAG: tRNA 2-selenouridine(34) synthase MnmH [Sphingobacteriia bacterium 39-39-8]HQR91783.1 tRNA 2-selenouridine(34) synthase MnmH [Sediminibacterium sp.]HQS53965.1 tRNA 2-selenouridine(34) synthase MnmH [Sediminibacterium sp.]